MSATSRARVDHAAFVAGRAGDLVRTAYAVCGDRAQAQDAVVRVLAGLRDDWAQVLETGSPQTHALTGVIRRLLHRNGSSGAQGADELTTLGSFDPQWGGDDHLDRTLLTAYAALPAAVRAALTLRLRLLLHWEAAAGILGRSLPDPQEAVARGLRDVARARDEGADRAGRPRPTRPIEPHLAAALEAAVDGAGLPHDLTTEVEGAVRAGLLRRRALVSGLAAGAALTAAGGLLAQEQDRRRSAVAAPRTGGPNALSPVHSLPGGLASWPVRGAMARDAGLQAAVAGAGPPPVAVDDAYGQMMAPRVLWADRVDGRALAAVAYPFVHPTGTNITGLGLAWFRSPSADPGRCRRDEGRPAFFADSTNLLAVATNARGGGSLVVLAAPDRPTVSWSDTVDYDLDARSSRTDWRPLRLRDGVVVQPLGRALGSVVRVRAAGHEAKLALLADNRPDVVDLAGLRTDAADPGPVTRRLVAWASDRAARVTGVAPGLVTTSVLTSAVVDHDPTGLLARGTARARVVVLLSALPWDIWGAVLRTVAAYPMDGSRTSRAVLVETLLPVSAATASQEPVIVATSPRSADDNSTSLLVLAPGATMVTIAAPGIDVSRRVQDGVVTLGLRAVLEHGVVMTRDADLQVNGQWAWPPVGSRDPLAMTQPPRF